MPLGPNADAGDYVDDFKTSDAPQFKGKSNKKRRQMAIAAFLDAKNKSKKENVGENKMKTFDEIREGAKADKPRGGTGIGFAPNPIKGSAKEIDTVKKMMNHPDYGGNTDKLHKALLNKFPGADKPEHHMHKYINKAVETHAAANESVEEKYTQRQRTGREAGRGLGPAGREYVKKRMDTDEPGSINFKDLAKRQHGGGTHDMHGDTFGHDTSSRPQDKLAKQGGIEKTKKRLKDKKSMANYQKNQQAGRFKPFVGIRQDYEGTEYTQPTINEKGNVEEKYSLAQRVATAGAHKSTRYNELDLAKRIGTKAYAKLQKKKKEVENDPKKNWRLGGSGGDSRNPTGSMVGNRESVELDESTNWKGSKSISLSRYSAKQGFGVQLSQLKAMPGESIPVSGIHIKMPLKEIPQLIKGLQNVYRAKPGVQLGDDD